MKHGIVAMALICGNASWAGPQWIRGEIVDPPMERQLTIKHEAIKSLHMGPMTMPFLVDARISLVSFKAGDRIRFRVHQEGAYLKIEALERVK